MDINKDNYELFLFQYQEGLLSPQEREEVEYYLRQHPEAEEMMRLYDPELRLHDEEPLLFPDKQQLKRRSVAFAPRAMTPRWMAVAASVAVLLGIGLHYAWPTGAARTDRVLTRLAFPLLLLLITVFYIQHRRTIMDNISLLGLCVTMLILTAIGCSSLLSRLVKNSPQQRRTVVIEVGMQNAAQAIAIASSPLIFANDEMAIPAILYSLMMNIVLLTYVAWVRKHEP